jgi:holo-[acyl-carrier protein] synthase
MVRTNGLKKRVFTPLEIKYCDGKKNSAQNYAARFAAKEAFMKALGTGWRKGVAFKDIEVVNEESGKPGLVLYGKAKELAEAMGVVSIHVSLTHLKSYASAVVTLGK